MPIRIASPQELLKIDKAYFRKVAESVLANEDINAFEISLAFVDDATSQRVNNQFLKHDYPTDVISFPYSAGKSLQGELVLGVEVALREAAERGHDPIAKGRTVFFPVLFSQQVGDRTQHVKAVATCWREAWIRRSRSVQVK